MAEHEPGESSGGNIRTFLRIRPSRDPSGLFQTDDNDPSRLRFELPVELKAGEFVNNSLTRHDFKFCEILGPKATQEEVFTLIGRDAVMNVLDGYNSTIFAYGQTGSGKTFTVTGGAERYTDRGIIPRALSLLFSEFKKRSDAQYNCHVSYLEIYNEQGYDLLDPNHETMQLEDLQKVTLMEDESGSIHLKNLSMHMSASEEEALNYLFIGDTNRAISETAMNKASSRSHCIFTVSIEGRKVGGDRVLRSKLHLVDLAGSERVHKTRTTGQTLQEAKYINTSLFYLEMVIVALHEKSKGRRHVPYRNSLMTSVLRDSLGGNCKTVMVATINPEQSHTEESISTCRFAQRVSLIKNVAVVNEDLDPALLIQKLKREIVSLKEEIAYLKSQLNPNGEGEEKSDYNESVSATERSYLMTACAEYVASSDPLESLRLGTPPSMAKIRDAFAILKNMILEAQAKEGTGDGTRGNPEVENQLRATLQEREAEIAILVNMIKQGKQQQRPDSTSNRRPSSDSNNNNVMQPQQVRKEHPTGVPPPPDLSLLDDPQAAFDYFHARWSGNAAVEENKTVLQAKYSQAKSAGARVNQARSAINYLKGTIEQIRRERAMDGLMDNSGDGKEEEKTDPEEAKFKLAIDEEKRIYKNSYQELRDLKAEIEAIQSLLEKSRIRLQNEFESWCEYCSAHPTSSTTNVPPPPTKQQRNNNNLNSSQLTDSTNSTVNMSSTTSSSSYSNGNGGANGVPISAWGPSNGQSQGRLPQLTGHKEADQDIEAFYRASEEVQRRRGSRGGASG